MGEIAERAGQLRRRLPAVADEDVSAYSVVSAAAAGEERTAALERASGPPREVAESAAELSRLAAEVVDAGDWPFTPDAAVAAQLAAAAAGGGLGAGHGKPGRRMTTGRNSVLEPTLVDTAEAALRERLAPGRARPGDRLPPEKQLAEGLGISRGTLRLALERLEANGEIVRRQGSGTFVGRVASPPAFSEGLEVLESYASLARRQGKRLSVRNLQIEQAPVPGYVAEALGLRRKERATLVHRTLLADGSVAAYMRDVVHPAVDLGPLEELGAALETGLMVLDVLVEHGASISFARTTVRPRLIEPGSRLGEAIGANRVTAALELVELIHGTGGGTIQHSSSVFTPGSIDLHVIRSFHPSAEG